MQDNRAIGRAAHPRVGDAHHVLDPGARQLLRDRQIAGLRHPRGRQRPGILQHQKSSGFTSRAGSSIRADKSSSDVKTTALPSFSKSFGSAAERLKIAPWRDQPSRTARQPTTPAAAGRKAALPPAVDRPGRCRQTLAERLAGHRQAIEMQQRLQLADPRRPRPRRTNPPCNAGRSASDRPAPASSR